MNDRHNQPGARFLSTRHACTYADVSKATLFRVAKQGALHPVRFGKRFTRWSTADLDLWIEHARR